MPFFFHIQAFPRLVLRKSPSQTLVPVAELGQLLSPAAKYAMVAEGRSLVRGAALMVQELGTWVKEKAGDDPPELTTSHVSRPTLLPVIRLVRLDFVQNLYHGRPFWSPSWTPRWKHAPISLQVVSHKEPSRRVFRA